MDKLISDNESIFLEQQSLIEFQRDDEQLNLIEKSQREEIYQYSGMVSVKFGRKWVIIKESQKIGKILLAELLGNEKYYK